MDGKALKLADLARNLGAKSRLSKGQANKGIIHILYISSSYSARLRIHPILPLLNIWHEHVHNPLGCTGDITACEKGRYTSFCVKMYILEA